MPAMRDAAGGAARVSSHMCSGPENWEEKLYPSSPAPSGASNGVN